MLSKHVNAHNIYLHSYYNAYQFTFQGRGNLLQSFQAAFESQSEDIAKLVAKQIVQEDCFMITNINLTAVDANAMVFVMKHVKGLKILM